MLAGAPGHGVTPPDNPPGPRGLHPKKLELAGFSHFGPDFGPISARIPHPGPISGDFSAFFPTLAPIGHLVPT